MKSDLEELDKLIKNRPSGTRGFAEETNRKFNNLLIEFENEFQQACSNYLSENHPRIVELEDAHDEIGITLWCESHHTEIREFAPNFLEGSEPLCRSKELWLDGEPVLQTVLRRTENFSYVVETSHN